MNFSDIIIQNPKRKKHADAANNEIFPYYAGYSDDFAYNVISSIKAGPNFTILDPWNGSGTTTYISSRIGIPAIGLDINPVMVIVARSRMLPFTEADSLLPLAAEIIGRAQRNKVTCEESDPLLWWFEQETADWLRSIEASIRSTLLGDLSITHQGTNFDRISSIASTLYVALFNAAKTFVSAFQASNPTWLRKPKSGETRARHSLSAINSEFQHKINRMSASLMSKNILFKPDQAPTFTRLFDSTQPFDMNASIDFVLTSPPYCTRIDYTAATRIQLAILHPLMPISIDDLSRGMIGSIKVPLKNPEPSPDLGKKCMEFLERVEAHQSRASRSYYLKTHIDYYNKMNNSIKNIADCLKRDGTAILVVQDSYYKEVHNDVPSIVAEISSLHGLLLRRKDDFRVKSLMSGINPRAHNKNSAITESVLCLQKQS